MTLRDLITSSLERSAVMLAGLAVLAAGKDSPREYTVIGTWEQGKPVTVGVLAHHYPGPEVVSWDGSMLWQRTVTASGPGRAELKAAAEEAADGH